MVKVRKSAEESFKRSPIFALSDEELYRSNRIYVPRLDKKLRQELIRRYQKPIERNILILGIHGNITAEFEVWLIDNNLYIPKRWQSSVEQYIDMLPTSDSSLHHIDYRVILNSKRIPVPALDAALEQSLRAQFGEDVQRLRFKVICGTPGFGDVEVWVAGGNVYIPEKWFEWVEFRIETAEEAINGP